MYFNKMVKINVFMLSQTYCTYRLHRLHKHTKRQMQAQHKCCGSHTQSLQSASTRPLLRSSCSRAKFPLRAAQNTALARGVSFCKTHVVTYGHYFAQRNGMVVLRTSTCTWSSPGYLCSAVKTLDSQPFPCM